MDNPPEHVPRVRLDELPLRDRIRIWLTTHLPAGLLWHPFEWFVAVLCVISGTVALVWHVDSASLDALLPHPFLKVWGAALLVGAVALMRGLSSIRALSADRYVVTRVPAYRLGLRLLGLAVSVYIAALITFAGWSGVLASVVPAAFVAMCSIRLLSLGGRR